MKSIKYMNAKILNNAIACIIFGGMFSACESSNYNDTPAASLSLPDRQILALNDKRLLVEFNINNGLPQKYFLEPDQTTIDVSVGGVRDNQNNTIDILWSAIYNDMGVEISTQNQEFFARGNIVIDAPHVTDFFDYDKDGISNYAELLDGTCVWYTGNQCYLDGVIDKPTSPALSQGLIPDYSFDYNNADDLIVNGDFSRGTEGWGADYAWLQSVGTHLCSTLDAGTFPVQYPVLASGSIGLEPGEHMIEFDVKSTRDNAALNVQLYSFARQQVVLYEFVQPLSLDWGKRRIKYTYSGEQDNFSLQFSAVINNSQTTTYCFDNVSVFKAQ